MSSPSPSTSPRRLPSDSEDPAPPSPAKPDSPSPPPPKSAAFPGREDCWSEEATRTLIDAWGAHYLALNRGNLRQQQWREVADAVNAAHATKLRRSDVQCKNRIDTTKKKYKIEKAKSVQSNGRYASSWPHFHSLDALIGDSFSKSAAAGNKNHRRKISPPSEISPSPSPSLSPEPISGHRKISPAVNRSPLLRLPWTVPVGPRSKRSGPGGVTERNFSVMAAAAAAMEAGRDEEYGDSGLPSAAAKRRKKAVTATARTARRRDGYRMLAAAIMSLGETYEKVEVAKQRQMVEFEKQRMQFAKDLELLRAQVQLDNLKHFPKYY